MTAQTQAISLESRVEEIYAATGGRVDVGEVAGIVAALMSGMDGALSIANLRLREELTGLIDYIEAAKAEIHGLQPQDMSQRRIPDAADELDAIVAATEAAAHKIMDAAEEIEAMAAEADGATQERLSAMAARIYEASTFQDITGQRITKVVRTLQQLETRLAALAAAVGDTFVAADAEVAFNESGHVVDEKALLHGPQLPTAANSQADIDALLASFD